MTIDPALLQILADRIHGLSVNGTHAGQFPEPLATLWRALDATSTDPVTVTIQWAGTDQNRNDLIAQIFSYTPGTPPPPDLWQIFSLRDAYKPRPPLKYIVEDTISVPSLVAVYGAPGSFKSMLIADMMVCVASGIDWLPPLDPSKPNTTKATIQTPALWCDFDNGNRRTAERFEALSRARALPDSTPLFYVSMPSPWLDCSDAGAVDDLKRRIKRLGAQLVVIDNLGSIAGDADENKADMVKVMISLRSVAEDTGAALIVLHHQRKGYSGTSTSRAGESLRGHTSIEAALDLALLVEREAQTDNLVAKSTKTRDVDVFPFGAQFDCTHKSGTREMATAEFRGVVIDNPKSAGVIQTAIAAVVTAQQPISKTMVVQEVQKTNKVGRDVIRRELDDMISLGLIDVKPGPYNAIYCVIP